MGRRTLLLLAALAVAALGTVLVYLYVQGLERRYAAEQELQEVLVAQAPIAPGTTLQAAAEGGAVTTAELPKAAVLAGAVSEIGPLGDQVATIPLYPGEQIVPEKFAAAGRAAFDIPDPAEDSGQDANLVAVSLALGEPERSSALLRAGSDVAVVVTYEEGTRQTTRTLFDRVTVLAAGADSVTDPAGTGGGESEQAGGLVTLALTPEQALVAVNAKAQGALYLALLDAESDMGAQTPVTRRDWTDQ